MPKRHIHVAIFEENEYFAKLMSDYFIDAGIKVSGIANNKNSLFRILNKCNPDFLISDIIFPKDETINILKKIRETKEYKFLKIIIATCFDKKEIFTESDDKFYDYYIQKPFDIKIIIDLIYNECGDVSNNVVVDNNSFIEKQIEFILYEIGIFQKDNGYKFIKQAVIEYMNDPDVINAVTKELYPIVAKKFETTPIYVERAIRHCLENAYDNGYKSKIESVLDSEFNSKTGRPTNRQLIILIADKIKEFMEY